MITEINIKHAGGVTPVLVGAGLLSRLGEMVREKINPTRVAIVTDENVAPLYLGAGTTGLENEGFQLETFILPAGEATKSFASLESLLAGLLDFGLDRGDLIIALGGGVIGDLAGLAASLLKRGVNLVQVPTTLLAQVDSSVGGKTGINTSHGKNLIGSFYQARLVIADVETLKTLPVEDFRSGYAEVVKHAILSGPAAFKHLEETAAGFFNRNVETLAATLSKSIKVKAGIVELDEREGGQRMLLNLGHSFGHGLEVLANYAGLRHGEAVSIGICLAFKFALQEGILLEKDFHRVKAHLEKVGLPTNLKATGLNITPGDLLSAMMQDKKKSAGAFRLVLPRGLGDVIIEGGISNQTLDDFLKTVEL
ncbi:MAG: 3-dehydroquinate synthase [Sphingomonadales bacterium]